MFSERKKQLIADIDSLGERFPVAFVSKLTGYSKSNVSEYYNGEKEPTEQFLRKFYKEFFLLKKQTDSGIKNIVEEPTAPYISKLDVLMDIVKKQTDTILSQQNTISLLVGNSVAPNAANAIG